MKIKSKIIFIVLPLIITTLVLTGISSYFSARTGINRIANDFLGFKTEELEKNAYSNWDFLVQLGKTDQKQYAEQGIESFARSLIKRPTELILAIDKDVNVVLKTKPFELQENEKAFLKSLFDSKERKLVEPVLDGIDRVATGFYFSPFEWYFLITEEKDVFYQDINQITFQSLLILGVSLVISFILLWFFASYLTKPLTKVVGTMKDIITYNDLSERVTVEFKDETGELAHTFNIMIGELEKAYNQIKSFALKAVLAQRNEKKVRQIFQKYVPKDVIDQFFAHPESMLTGENRVLAVLFSDIRSFTTISESMMPDALVNTLNRYFSMMVDIIMARSGIVDKYIGDAIMAFFGAPVKHEDDALQSVMAGLEMIDSLTEFNRLQREKGIPEFHIGVGINYGVVTVGNIGSEKKMDYTAIGDMVNLASRLEGLTKKYHQPMVVSESVNMKIKDHLPTRLLDKVAVKGKTRGVEIYTVTRKLNDRQKRAWDIHTDAVKKYYAREFIKAQGQFQEIRKILPNDYIADMFIKRCESFKRYPPAANWTGVEVMTEK